MLIKTSCTIFIFLDKGGKSISDVTKSKMVILNEEATIACNFTFGFLFLRLNNL